MKQTDNTIIATMKYLDEDTTVRKFASQVLKALSGVSQCDCGTLANPSEIASAVLENSDRRTLIRRVLDGEDVYFNDGYLAIDIRTADRFIYTDIAVNLRDINVDMYSLETNCAEDSEDGQDWAKGYRYGKTGQGTIIYARTPELLAKELKRRERKER